MLELKSNELSNNWLVIFWVWLVYLDFFSWIFIDFENMSLCTSLEFKQPVTKPNLLPLSFFLSVFPLFCMRNERNLSLRLFLSRYGWLYEVINAGIFRWGSEYFYEHTHDGGSFDSAERQSLKREWEKKAEGKKRVLAERGFSPEGV